MSSVSCQAMAVEPQTIAQKLESLLNTADSCVFLSHGIRTALYGSCPDVEVCKNSRELCTESTIDTIAERIAETCANLENIAKRL